MVFDHGINGGMHTMPISKFKATCLATLERVRRTGQPLCVPRFGKPIAEIMPPTPAPLPRNCMGGLRGTGKILADLTSPTGDLVEWEVHE